jgi:putative ABC transport system permease protein
MVTQYQGFADINMGIGIVIFGLGSVMIGNTIYELLKLNNLFFRLIFILLGAILFRIVLALALSFGADPSMLKLITAAMVLLIVALPRLKKSN